MREGVRRKELGLNKNDMAAHSHSQVDPQAKGHMFYLTNIFLCVRYLDKKMSKINSISALWEFTIVCLNKNGGIREREEIEVCKKKSSTGQIMMIYSHSSEMSELQP